MSLGKKLRFEVFKRDSFTCQYCGAKAPDVVLQADHISPVAEGGTDDLLNLVTACQPCNAGKGKRTLTDDAVVEKQRAQLEALQERREQIEMMMEWQQSLVSLDADKVGMVADLWAELAPGFTPSDTGRQNIAKWIRKHGISEVAEAMRIAAGQYLEWGEEGKVTPASWDIAFHKVGGILIVRHRERENPGYRTVAYGLGILRKKVARGQWGYLNESLAGDDIEAAMSWGVTHEEALAACSRATSWSDWRRRMADLIEQHKSAGGGD